MGCLGAPEAWGPLDKTALIFIRSHGSNVNKNKLKIKHANTHTYIQFGMLY